ncbi:MAG: hypothetical protein K0R49_826 [Burkholderiales bacterium]|jgi:putative lipoic acid-binding regulatory protein|nr:hypothetical protein [Burkholderiales bacterium]
MDTPSNTEKLIKFPCLFPIKIMGNNHIDLVPQIIAIISRHTLQFNPQDDIVTRLSKQGNYLSVTATIMATSQEQLDEIYTELNKHELVKMTL